MNIIQLADLHKVLGIGYDHAIVDAKVKKVLDKGGVQVTQGLIITKGKDNIVIHTPRETLLCKV